MSDPLLHPLRTTALYNPHLLSKEELIELFTARSAILERLLAAITETRRGKVPQHHLVVGQRGMGRTMLLRRLKFELEDHPELAGRWLALSFPEEQYNVGRLSDFWLNCLDALAERLEDAGQHEEAERLDEALEDTRHSSEQERAAEALELLLETAKRLKKRLALLVDNVDLVFERIQQDGWKLREVLAHEPAILLIGASTRFMEETYEYEQPFYDFFAVHELRGLTADETIGLLRHYAGVWKSPEVLRITDQEPARIRTLHALSGGNPRTLAMLYTILARGINGNVRSDLEVLLDQATPLYKARLEALPPQAQQVLHGLAVHWAPWSAGELAAELRIEVNVVSSHLNRLSQQGIVEKVPYDPPSKTGFQVAERFFNIWYLMRMARRARRKLIWLVEFLRLFYSEDDLHEQALRLTLEGDSLPCHPQVELTAALRDRDWSQAAVLLDNLDLSDRVRPFREALETIVQGRRTYLRRVAPEVRGAAEEIVNRLVGKEWTGTGEPPRPAAAKRRVKRRA